MGFIFEKLFKSVWQRGFCVTTCDSYLHSMMCFTVLFVIPICYFLLQIHKTDISQIFYRDSCNALKSFVFHLVNISVSTFSIICIYASLMLVIFSEITKLQTNSTTIIIITNLNAFLLFIVCKSHWKKMFVVMDSSSLDATAERHGGIHQERNENRLDTAWDFDTESSTVQRKVHRPLS